jgi:hypothetical protein
MEAGSDSDPERERCWDSTRRIVSIATSVLPLAREDWDVNVFSQGNGSRTAPVGARGTSVSDPRRTIQKDPVLPHTNIFSFEPYAVG